MRALRSFPTLTPPPVSKHNTPESCWVILYGHVYDVTSFLNEHPGGSKIILQLAGTDATEEYDPIHPPGILEESLPAEAKLGKFDESTIPKEEKAPAAQQQASQAAAVGGDAASTEPEGPPDLESLLNLDDIEAAATKQISAKGWAYYYSASDDLFSKSYNGHVYRHILMRPRVFVDCTACDTSTTLLGHKVDIPLYVSPAAMARLAHPDGEHGIAQACARFGALQVVSNNASMTPEQVVAGAAPDQMFGWQLYVQTERRKSEAMLQRIAKLPQYKFVCLTLDAPVPGKREHDERSKNVGSNLPVRSSVQEGSASTPAPKKEESGGIGKSLFQGTAPDLTWKTTLPWLAKHTQLPIVLKGVQTHEDAYLAAQYAPQIKGIILSNHGGRAMDTAPPAVHTLLEIRKYCPEVFDKIEVWVDGGIKRGTDVVKALCLGAKAVGVGRAALYGLGAGGKEGVARVFESKLLLHLQLYGHERHGLLTPRTVLKAETETAMRLLGVEKVEDLGMRHVSGTTWNTSFHWLTWYADQCQTGRARSLRRPVQPAEASLVGEGQGEVVKIKHLDEKKTDACGRFNVMHTHRGTIPALNFMLFKESGTIVGSCWRKVTVTDGILRWYTSTTSKNSSDLLLTELFPWKYFHFPSAVKVRDHLGEKGFFIFRCGLSAPDYTETVQLCAYDIYFSVDRR